MGVVIVTGSAGLIGAESVRLFSRKGFQVVGIDNDLRRFFFGEEASTAWCRRELEATIESYRHAEIDIRDRESTAALFAHYGSDIALVIHTAAQPSHDWAAKDPETDFTVNANGTLTLLEATRRHCPRAAFIFTSTNKVYGDGPNALPLVELDTRLELPADHPYYEHGIDEAFPVDQCTHSLFGVSKLAADALVQEYGRYFGMNTVCFRGGCLTGSGHSGAMLHGFLSYLMRCAVTGHPYTIIGYDGKQVRDNLHAQDLVQMFWHYFQAPRPGEVYNAGGGRHSNCSVREAVAHGERLTGRRMAVRYVDENRQGDHRWWISNTRKFQAHYPQWRYSYTLSRILEEMHDALAARCGQEHRRAA